MAPKKKSKKTVKKSVKSSKCSCSHNHFSFLALLILVAGFSLYAITSFFTSTNDHLDRMYVSVVNDDIDVSEEVDVPYECYTCPAFEICEPLCGEVSEPYPVFTDIMSDHPNAAAIETLYFNGIINGYDNGSFNPDGKINRAELLTIITNAVDADFGGESYGHCFTDVTDQWFAVFVCYARAMGWVNGYDDGSYRPDLPVNKAAALKIVLTSLGYEIPESVAEQPYPDVALTDWFAGTAQVGKNNGIIESYGDFDASHEMTRAEFVQMVYNAMNI